MLDLWQKRKIRSVIYHRVTLVLLFLVVIFISHSTWTVYKKKAESEELKQVALAHLKSLQSRDSDLQSKIDRISTEPGIEEEIRSKFSVVKGDEKMVIVVDDEEKTTPTSTVRASFWQKIKDLFK